MSTFAQTNNLMLILASQQHSVYLFQLLLGVSILSLTLTASVNTYFGAEPTWELVFVSCLRRADTRSAVAPDGDSLDPMCCLCGVKRRKSRADVCSYLQPDVKSGFIPM